MMEEMLQEYAETRCVELRNKIVEENMGLITFVVKINMKSTFKGQDFEELLSFGAFGLIQAVEKFDPKKKVKFSTYAYQKIYYAIIDEMRKDDWVPRSVRSKIREVRNEVEYVERTLGYVIDSYTMAKDKGLSQLDVCIMRGTATSSLEAMTNYVYDTREELLTYDTLYS
jgi:RNA polymerase sigma factor for flagellar operon FliA